jgi:DNA replication ATP-dependent helicase Dna2
MPSLQTRAGGGGAASARPSALSTLLGLGPHASFGGARTTPARSAPPPAPAAWEQWIAAAAGPVSDGTTPGAAQRGVYSDAAATPGRMDVDGARGRATALTPASLAAAVAAAAAAAGASTLAPQHRGTRSAGAVPRTTGGAGSRRQQQRARLLALLEQIDAGTASEQTPAPAEAAPPAAFAAPPALDDFPVDPRDLAALLEAAAAVPQPQQQQPAAPCALVGVERADRQPLAALQANGPAGGVAAPLFPAAPAPLLCGIAVAADDDEWGSDFWEVPAPAAGAALRVLSAVDEARSDGGGPARRVRLRDDAAGVEYALELRDDWADTPLAPGDAVCVDAPWSFCGDATLRAAGPGRLVLHPEVLVSATAVAASLSCLRRAVLAERMGPGAPSTASLYGSATHALLQNALTAPPEALAAGQLPSRCDAAAVTIAAGAAASLQAVGQSEAELRKHLSSAAPHAAAWVAALRGGGPPVMASRPRGEPDAALELHRVADVEEMVWAPRAGLKGQLDATVEAQLGAGQAARRAPLELKTGRFRAAAEHGAQVALYTVLLAERHGRDGPDAPFGLLHYSVADTRGAPPATVVVAPDSRELASLMGARNALAAGIVAASRPGGALPPIAAARSECARCFRAADCATAAAALEGDDGSAAGVADVFQRHVAHVSPAAAAFLRHWDAICGAEVALLQQRAAAPWLPAHEVRRRGGTCLEVRPFINGRCFLLVDGLTSLVRGRACILSAAQRRCPPLARPLPRMRRWRRAAPTSATALRATWSTTSCSAQQTRPASQQLQPRLRRRTTAPTHRAQCRPRWATRVPMRRRQWQPRPERFRPPRLRCWAASARATACCSAWRRPLARPLLTSPCWRAPALRAWPRRQPPALACLPQRWRCSRCAAAAPSRCLRAAVMPAAWRGARTATTAPAW